MKLASGTTARAVPEWIGSSPDAAIPDRVKLRIFERYGGICQLTGKRLGPGEWDCDHIKPLKNGGQHRESNLHPVWRPKHREKTAQENTERAAVNRKKVKHLLPRAKGNWPSRKFSQPRYDNTKRLEEL